PGHRFQRGDFRYRMEVAPIAELRLPTGRIVAADPVYLDQRVEKYFSRTVRPGSYPVDLSILHTGMIKEKGTVANSACIRVRFRDAAVAEWVIATTGDQNPDDLPPFHIYGYGVERGQGSVADSSGLVAVLQEYKAQGKAFSDEFYYERVVPAYLANKGHF